MSKPTSAPQGSWKSPISAANIAAGTIGLGGVRIGPDRSVYWREMRPAEGGRQAIVRTEADGRTTELVPPPFNARTRVHEYGGGSYLICGRSVVFSNFVDQRLYRSDGAGEPRAITPEAPLRYADAVCDEARSRLICVREDHTADSPGEVVNTIAAVYPGRDGASEVLISGNDFYSSPHLSPDGTQLAYLTWNHPDMPWDAAELWVARLADDGCVVEKVKIAGGEGESVTQPCWSPGEKAELYFVSDRTDWWNIYRLRGGRVEQVTDLPAEFATPQWVFGMSSYAFVSAGRIICAYTQAGTWKLARLDTETRALEPIDVPFTHISDVRCDGRRVVFCGGAPAVPLSVVSLDPASGRWNILRSSSDLRYDGGYISSPRAVEFPTAGGLTAHGLFYAPANKDFTAPPGEKPPLVVMIHGGPTGATTSALRLKIQYYTSRGVAVLDVNYGGSTGYGRTYRRRLNGQWGVVDVDDACNGAKHLADAGLVDGRRMAITGGSAGGYTTLAALAFRDTFAAGASHYGVSDCEAMAVETHKFESRYLDKLIGPYPRQRELYVQRSPIHHLEGFRRPIIFFQGLEDKIVPPNQAEMMFDALKARGIATAYLPFAGEQHGFRKAQNIRRAIEAELYFFAKVFGFTPADEIAPVAIENL